MLSDLFSSFKENIRQKTTNPFFGTLIIVWTFKNWKLLFILLNFDDNTKLDDKINLVSNYFDSTTFLENLIGCVAWSFLILIASYFLLNLSRLIINFFEKVVTPIVYKLTDKGSIVLKSDYDKSNREIERLEKRLDEERGLRVKAQNEYEVNEKKLEEERQSIIRMQAEYANFNKELEEERKLRISFQSEYDNLKKELEEEKRIKMNLRDEYEKLLNKLREETTLKEQFQNNNKELINRLENKNRGHQETLDKNKYDERGRNLESEKEKQNHLIDSKFQLTLNKILNNPELFKSFDQIAERILNNERQDNTNVTRELVKLGLINAKGITGDSNMYFFTDLGSKIYDSYVTELLKKQDLNSINRKRLKNS